RDVGVFEIQLREGADREVLSKRERVDPALRDLSKLLHQAELVHELQRRRVDRVAAEVAKEVAVLLEDGDLDPCSGEQEPQHHPRWSSTNDDGGRTLRIDGVLQMGLSPEGTQALELRPDPGTCQPFVSPLAAGVPTGQNPSLVVFARRAVQPGRYGMKRILGCLIALTLLSGTVAAQEGTMNATVVKSADLKWGPPPPG